MAEQRYEIVVSDPDIQSLSVSWYNMTGGLFIEQIEVENKKHLIVLNEEETKQLVAVLIAYLKDPSPHKSDCALHNSPAYPLEQCTCR